MTMTDFGLIITYLMISVAVLACIFSPILQMKNDINKMKKMIAPLIGLITLIFVSIILSSNEVLPSYTSSDGVMVSATSSKIIGGCLITFYILSIIAIMSVIYSEILYKFFENGKK